MGRGECTELYVYIYSHPLNCCCSGGVFIQTNFERKVKGASALYCVYILKKNKVLYVFITLIIVIKGLPFLICGFGGFLFVFLFWGFVFCFVFCFSGQTKKTKKNLAFSVCTAAGQDIKY